MPKKPRIDWTPERISLFRRLARDGKTAAEIGTALGLNGDQSKCIKYNAKQFEIKLRAKSGPKPRQEVSIQHG